MQINGPEQLIQTLDVMLSMMNKTQRKNFFEWVKRQRKQYDFVYPEGRKGELNVKKPVGSECDSSASAGVAPVAQASDQPVPDDSGSDGDAGC